MLVLAIFFIFITAVFFAYFVLPILYWYFKKLNQQRTQRFSVGIERVVPRAQAQHIIHMYLLAPIGFGGLGYLFAPPGRMQLAGAILGIALGLIFPGLYTKFLISRNKTLFDNQLIDALMIMSSSFRGGLSLIQALEAVAEEMTDPMAEEIQIVLGESKMGVSLEEALEHLYKRKPSAALQQMVTAILLGRETGGNIPVIFQRIVGVVRQRRTIEGQIATLTLQGRIQGVVMSILPVAFFFFINSSNPTHFNIMYVTEIGRTALLIALVLEVVGATMIWKISAFKDF